MAHVAERHRRPGWMLRCHAGRLRRMRERRYAGCV
jgi:hypothetical protein